MAEVIITTQNFENEVIKSDRPVLIDFWATWCGPCRMLSPIIEEIANEYSGKLKVCKVNVDEQPELANAFSVSSIPMVVLMEGGRVKKTAVGYRPKEDIVAMFE